MVAEWNIHLLETQVSGIMTERMEKFKTDYYCHWTEMRIVVLMGFASYDKLCQTDRVTEICFLFPAWIDS